MKNEIKINVPEGMEIDKENSTFECIKFKPKKKELPKTWEEFCRNNPIKCDEYYINAFSCIKEAKSNKDPANNKNRHINDDANMLPSKEYAEAMLALCKLIQLRDCYNDGWEPDWKNSNEVKYVIRYFHNEIDTDAFRYCNCVLSFKTEKLRDTFLDNFRDLIEKAKPLL